MPAPDRALPDVAALRLALCPPWQQLDVVSSTGSTNAELVTAAGRGAPDRTVLIAHAQTGGRGRRDRTWTSPPGAGLTGSVLLRPTGVPAAGLGFSTLLVGLAVLDALREDLGVADAGLKWPNDVLVGDRKLAGILAESVPGPAVVVGLGLNVSLAADELPAPTATSLALLGVDAGTTEVATAVLRRVDALERTWRAAGGDTTRSGLMERYRSGCSTLGARVRVDLAGGELVGTAVDVDPTGRLVVRADDGAATTVAAGDVTHLRGAGRSDGAR